MIIDRSVEEVYAFLADLKAQLGCWEMLYVPNLDRVPDDAVQLEGMCSAGRQSQPCIIELHHTRPGSGAVTRITWATGELAAEWRVMQEGDRTRVELNVEGSGGGLAANVHVRQITPRILARLKQHFDRT